MAANDYSASASGPGYSPPIVPPPPKPRYGLYTAVVATITLLLVAYIAIQISAIRQSISNSDKGVAAKGQTMAP